MRQTSVASDKSYRGAGRDPEQNLYPAILLFAMTILAQMVSLAFGRLDHEQSFSQIFLPSLMFLSVITLPACYFGVVLGRQIGLGVTQFDELIARRPGAVQRLGMDLIFAALLGIFVGMALLLLRQFTGPYLPPELPQLGFRGVTGGLAVSLGAAVAEEVWFRLGLMTFLVWSIARLRRDGMASPAVIWSVIVFSAIAFAAAHLPQVVAYGAASVVAVAGTLFGNVLVGTLYGWVYWQKGILAAMVSHFSVDLMLHVMSVLVW
jgi:membrane protease YdiL (CAAX protease family)